MDNAYDFSGDFSYSTFPIENVYDQQPYFTEVNDLYTIPPPPPLTGLQVQTYTDEEQDANTDCSNNNNDEDVPPPTKITRITSSSASSPVMNTPSSLNETYSDDNNDNDNNNNNNNNNNDNNVYTNETSEITAESLLEDIPRSRLADISSEKLLEWSKYLSEKYTLTKDQAQRIRSFIKLAKNREAVRKSRAKAVGKLENATKKNEELLARIAALEAEVKRLRQENESLKRKHD